MTRPAGPLITSLFALIPVGVMLLAISDESFWIDEFWNAYFASIESLTKLVELLRIPSGSQTPLHFAYSFFWGQLFSTSELGLRLSNLPLFVIGQWSLYWALRDYPRQFAFALLTVSSLHPMIWQYANEVRPYIMMYAGGSMMLAYLLHLNAIKTQAKLVSPGGTAIFVVGSILLFGASLLGAFWVAAACVYVVAIHDRHLGWRYLKEPANLALLSAFLVITGLLTIYYLSSLLRGGGASRISSTTPATLLFGAYELLGLSGLGPSRLALREAGIASLHAYWVWLTLALGIILAASVKGLLEAKNRLGTRWFVLILVLGMAPVLIVVASGFAMHWRVLGRHLIGSLPLLNVVLALGLAKLCAAEPSRGRPWRLALAGGLVLALAGSSLSLRFAERHAKDDYRAAADIARQALADGKRVWWAADALGAWYYKLPGEFDYWGELTGMHKPAVCIDMTGVQSVVDASADCLRNLQLPDVVILSKPETFDRSGALTEYLSIRHFDISQALPAFTVWRPTNSPRATQGGAAVPEKSN